jgi:hypothetical protein
MKLPRLLSLLELSGYWRLPIPEVRKFLDEKKIEIIWIGEVEMVLARDLASWFNKLRVPRGPAA